LVEVAVAVTTIIIWVCMGWARVMEEWMKSKMKMVKMK
jgi:hypothetical protein